MAEPSPDAPGRLRLRRRVHDVLDRTSTGGALERWVHGGLMALILANVAAVIIHSSPAMARAWPAAFMALEIASVAVFGVEYALRIWAAVEHPPLRHLGPAAARLRFALYPSSLIDLMALAPVVLALVSEFDLRTVMIFRLLRFFKLARYSAGLNSLGEAIWAERRALGACLVILCGAVLVAASAMHLAEGHVRPDHFGSIPEAMYWAVITLTTVGYGDVTPVTPLGKLIAAFTAIAGLMMLALPVAIISSQFAREIHRRDFVVTWSMVARVPLFAELNAAAVAEIMRYLKSRTAEAGEIIVRRGEPAHSMYFIAGGSVEVLLRKRRVVLGAGHFFGEVALLARQERSATVRALERTRLLVLEAEDLRVVMLAYPEVAARIEEVAGSRVRAEQLEPHGDIAREEIGDWPAVVSGPSAKTKGRRMRRP